MRSPVVVATTWSASQAEVLASRLRGQGIEAFTKSNFDRSAYGGEFGGAAVFVDAGQALEAELELVCIEESLQHDAPPRDDTGADDGTGGDAGDDEDVAPRRGRTWVRAAGLITVAALAVGAVLPSLLVVWRSFGS